MKYSLLLLESITYELDSQLSLSLSLAKRVRRTISFDDTIAAQNGCVDLQELERSITNDTVLVTIMHANNEVGTLQPLKEIAAICRRRSPSVLFHTDASQSLGKVRASISTTRSTFEQRWLSWFVVDSNSCALCTDTCR